MQLPSRCCLHRLDETSRAPSASSESQDASCHGCPMHRLRSIEKQTSLLSRRNPWSKSCSLYWKTMTHDYLNWPIKIKWFHLSLGKVGCAWYRLMWLHIPPKNRGTWNSYTDILSIWTFALSDLSWTTCAVGVLSSHQYNSKQLWGRTVPFWNLHKAIWIMFDQKEERVLNVCVSMFAWSTLEKNAFRGLLGPFVQLVWSPVTDKSRCPDVPTNLPASQDYFHLCNCDCSHINWS